MTGPTPRHAVPVKTTATEPGRPTPARSAAPGWRRALGNSAVAALAATTGHPERDADSTADRLTGTRWAAAGTAPSPTATGSPMPQAAGRPLSDGVRARFEAGFAADLGTVRVHTDAAAHRAAEQLGAAAFAAGEHIAFARGNYAPETSRGAWLLTHEIAHVLQHDPAGPAVVRCAPEDVPMLDRKLYEGVQRNSADGYREAAEALNAFSVDDIRLRLSRTPGAGRRALSRGQIAAVHVAARDHPLLGPGSNAATYTRVTYLDVNFENESALGRWELAAEFMNGFSDADMKPRLARLSIGRLHSLKAGAVLNPKVGPGSALARNVTQAIADVDLAETATQAGVQPPTTTGGSGAPGSATTVLVGGTGGRIDVPQAQREPLLPDRDWTADPAYIDRNIVRATYDLYTTLFRIEYADKSFVDLDLDQATAGAHSGGPPVDTFFRHAGRIYPSLLSRRSVPTISACALEIRRTMPAALQRAQAAWIDLAVAAHGVGGAVIRLGRMQAGPTTRKAAPAEKRPEDGAAPPPPAKTPSGPAAAPRNGSTPSPASTPGPKAPTPATATGRGGSAPRSGGGLQEVGPAGGLRFHPTEGLDLAAQGMKVPSFGAGLAFQLAHGEATLAGKVLGPATLTATKATARATGTVVVAAEGPLVVGTTRLAHAVLLTGGKFVPESTEQTGRTVSSVLVLNDQAYMISSGPTTDPPAKAPGAPAPAPAVEPGTPGLARAPGTETTPAFVPGPPTAAEISEPVTDTAADCERMWLAGTRHQHHIFPQEFESEFDAIGIEVDGYCISVKAEDHIRAHGRNQWNPEWAHFFAELPLRSLRPAERERWRDRALLLVTDQIKRMKWAHLTVRNYYPVKKKR